jgi:hypothetical protein
MQTACMTVQNGAGTFFETDFTSDRNRGQLHPQRLPFSKDGNAVAKKKDSLGAII